MRRLGIPQRPSDSSEALARKNDCKTHARSRVRSRQQPEGATTGGGVVGVCRKKEKRKKEKRKKEKKEGKKKRVSPKNPQNPSLLNSSSLFLLFLGLSKNDDDIII